MRADEHIIYYHNI